MSEGDREKQLCMDKLVLKPYSPFALGFCVPSCLQTRFHLGIGTAG